MTFEEILIKISEYWAVFLASGAYITLSAYGAVLIKQIFTKATASRVVTQITDGLLAGVLFIKVKIIQLFTKTENIESIVIDMQNQLNEIIDFIAEQRAFNEAILNASGQEAVAESYSANLLASRELITEVAQVVVEEATELVEAITEPETRKERKLRLKEEKKASKKANSEVRNEVVKEII